MSEPNAPKLRSELAPETCWDLTQIYKTDEEWEEAFRGLDGLLAAHQACRGHLADSAEDALRYVLDAPFIDAVVVGMQSRAEVDANLRFLETRMFSDEDRAALGGIHRTLHVEEYCEGCGACVRRCASGALTLVPVSSEEETPAGDFAAEFARQAGIATESPRFRACPDDRKCVRCGYCTKVCPVFALKIY